MQVKAENGSVSLTEALEEMNRAVNLLETARLKTEAWHDPVQLLDSTAHALDDAALALRETDKQPTRSLTEEEFLQVLLLQQQCQQVMARRQSILDATAAVLARHGVADTKKKKNEVLIVWATHTGMSKKMAHQLKQHMKSDAVAMNIKDLTLAQLLAHEHVYFCVSTFGRGRPPRDAEAFLSALQLLNGPDHSDKTAGVLLFGLQIAVAAFGNSSFADTFCKFGRTLSEQLCQLGAREVLPLATMDAKNGKVEQQRQFGVWQDQILIREGKMPVSSSIAETVIASKKQVLTTTSCCTIL